MAIGTRRRTRRTTEQERTAEATQRGAVVSGLFGGVLRSARNHLLAAESPLAAEVWGSGLLAVWDSEDDTTFGEALVRYAASVATPEALATLAALGAVAPSRLATKARTAAADLTNQGVTPPLWAGRVGSAVPTEAWLGTDVYGDQEILIIGFAYPEGFGTSPGSAGVPPGTVAPRFDAHTLCVLIDHNSLGGGAKDAYPAGDLASTLIRWEEARDAGIIMGVIPLAEAAARLSDALVATDFGAGTGPGGRLVEVRALLESRLAVLPHPVRTGTGEVTLMAREQLVAEFLSSPEAGPLLAEPAAVMVAAHVVAYRCDDGDGDPLRWSPTLAGLCLLDHFPARVTLDELDVALVPDVLAAWIGFAGRRRGLSEAAIARTLSAVEACRDDFALLMSDPPEFDLSGSIDLAGEEAAAEAVSAFPSR